MPGLKIVPLVGSRSLCVFVLWDSIERVLSLHRRIGTASYFKNARPSAPIENYTCPGGLSQIDFGKGNRVRMLMRVRGTPRTCGRARSEAHYPVLRYGKVCLGCNTLGSVEYCYGKPHRSTGPASPQSCLTARSVPLNWEGGLSTAKPVSVCEVLNPKTERARPCGSGRPAKREYSPCPKKS